MSLEPGVVEGQTLTADLTISADVVIVGSGAGGGVAADVFSAAGLKVLVLEEGGYFTKERFRMQEDEGFVQLYQEGGQRATADLSVALLQGRSVGGGTTVNWTTSYRTPEDVVAHWQRKHSVGGFKHSDLVRHWEAVEKRLGIHEVAKASMNANNRLLYEGCEALGYEAHLLKRNVRGCAQTGFCGMGCPIDAKQTMQLTYLNDAMERGATILSRCRVDRLIIEAGEVTGIQAMLLDAAGRDPTGVKVTVTAKRYVLSAGAIGSPAILLRSGAPDPHERTGARTFLHPNVSSLAEHDEVVNPFYGAPQSAASHEFAHRGDEVGYFLETAPLQPVIASNYTPWVGKQHHEALKKLPHLSSVIALAIDGFHDDVPGGQVKLHPSGAPLIDYRIAPRVRKMFIHAQKTMARIQLASGAKQVMTPHMQALKIEKEADIDRIDQLSFADGDVLVGSAHQMGGCGMGDDPKTSVVRSTDLRHHQLKNLFVLDGSVFPTSLGVNPQESIFGLSRLMATRIAEQT